MESGPGKEFLEFLQQTQQCLIALENNTEIVKAEKIIEQFNSQEMVCLLAAFNAFILFDVFFLLFMLK